MIKHKMRRVAIILAGIFLSYPQTSHASGFSGSDLLRYDKGAQESFIDISITMAASVATQTNPDVARCINDWYFKDTSVRPRRVEEILSVVRQYPNHHPSGVILAVLQKACGSFKG